MLCVWCCICKDRGSYLFTLEILLYIMYRIKNSFFWFFFGSWQTLQICHFCVCGNTLQSVLKSSRRCSSHLQVLTSSLSPRPSHQKIKIKSCLSHLKLKSLNKGPSQVQVKSSPSHKSYKSENWERNWHIDRDFSCVPCDF